MHTISTFIQVLENVRDGDASFGRANPVVGLTDHSSTFLTKFFVSFSKSGWNVCNKLPALLSSGV